MMIRDLINEMFTDVPAHLQGSKMQAMSSGGRQSRLSADEWRRKQTESVSLSRRAPPRPPVCERLARAVHWTVCEHRCTFSSVFSAVLIVLTRQLSPN